MTASRLHRWSPALRRALMKVRPEYFGWSPAEQERYGVAIPEKDREHLCQALLQELWGRKIRSPKAAARAASRLPLDEQHRWNEIVLPLTGIGDDCFFLNEGFTTGKSILDFPTLLAYDESDYRFQEEARRKDDSTYQGGTYRGSLYLTWARLFVGAQFTYATLSMAAGYTLCALEEAASELIQELIPHRYVPGKNHGKVEGKCYRWDRRLDAGGQEALLDELQHRTWAYTHERYENLLTEWDRHGKGGVYLIDVSEPPEKNIHFVFSDTRALGAVRFRFFMKDCRAIERPLEELHRAVEQEKIELTGFIRKDHDESRRTLDPSVVLSDLARDVDISVPTAKSWLSVLVASCQVFLLQPYHTSVTKRLVKTPKLYFLDTGLCAYLTGWASPATLAAGAMRGAIFETHVVAEILKSWWHQARNPQLYFYRDRDGREIDLVFDVDGKLWPVEIKHAATVRREWAAPFAALDRLKKPVGAGAVVCLSSDDLPVTQELTALPVGTL